MANYYAPWEMVSAHRYAQAVAAYRLELKTTGRDSASTWAEMATALLCLGELKEALKAFERAQSLHKIPNSLPYFDDIATVQWLLGMKTEALQTVRRAVDGVLDRSIIYTDMAGGVTQGVLLWYMGVSLNDEVSVAHAIKYLENRCKRERIQMFPGHIARYILGECPFYEVVKAATGGSNVEVAVAAAGSDLQKRRGLCEALFYDGVLCRSRNNEAGCLARMQKCHALENPILEVEWYLAAEECRRTR
jgi:tetratricopeptide (TPR) repeat protein